MQIYERVLKYNRNQRNHAIQRKPIINENLLKYYRNHRKSWKSMKMYQNIIAIEENHEILWKPVTIQ